jgi:DNA repair photolyase
MKKTKRISGTQEWAKENVNCLTGCSHACLYCYGKGMARRFKRISSDDEWQTPHLRRKEVTKRRKLVSGRVMFPTTHDITPEFLEPCLTVLQNLLTAGNQVLIVSKPHLECIKRICEEFADYTEQILFRFTIGADDDSILSFWEPEAPCFEERLKCLKHAGKQGFSTSVSMEPMLDTPRAVRLFHKLKPFVTDSIWLGKMNRARSQIKDRTPEIDAAIEQIEANQGDEQIEAIYEALKAEPLVRWKDSIKEIVGLPLAEQAGLDM